MLDDQSYLPTLGFCSIPFNTPACILIRDRISVFSEMDMSFSISELRKLVWYRRL